MEGEAGQVGFDSECSDQMSSGGIRLGLAGEVGWTRERYKMVRRDEISLVKLRQVR